LPKVKITISIEVDLVKWLDEQVAKGHFSNRSEAAESCIKKAAEGKPQ